MKLSELRRERNLTQRQLADLAQVNISQIQKFEYERDIGRASARVVASIAKALNVTVEELLK